MFSETWRDAIALIGFALALVQTGALLSEWLRRRRKSRPEPCDGDAWTSTLREFSKSTPPSAADRIVQGASVAILVAIGASLPPLEPQPILGGIVYSLAVLAGIGVSTLLWLYVFWDLARCCPSLFESESEWIVKPFLVLGAVVLYLLSWSAFVGVFQFGGLESENWLSRTIALLSFPLVIGLTLYFVADVLGPLTKRARHFLLRGNRRANSKRN